MPGRRPATVTVLPFRAWGYCSFLGVHFVSTVHYLRREHHLITITDRSIIHFVYDTCRAVPFHRYRTWAGVRVQLHLPLLPLVPLPPVPFVRGYRCVLPHLGLPRLLPLPAITVVFCRRCHRSGGLHLLQLPLHDRTTTRPADLPTVSGSYHLHSLTTISTVSFLHSGYRITCHQCVPAVFYRFTATSSLRSGLLFMQDTCLPFWDATCKPAWVPPCCRSTCGSTRVPVRSTSAVFV